MTEAPNGPRCPVSTEENGQKLATLTAVREFTKEALQGVDALQKALAAALLHHAEIDAASAGGELTQRILTMDHAGGWTSSVLLVNGNLPYLELHAPGDDEALVKAVGELIWLAPRQILPGPGVLSDRPDLRGDVIYVWLSAG